MVNRFRMVVYRFEHTMHTFKDAMYTFEVAMCMSGLTAMSQRPTLWSFGLRPHTVSLRVHRFRMTVCRSERSV
jgi:hypothetical protein